MARITRHSWKFDLVVLSTCFSGTPRTIAALTPYAQTIIASPDNLHLSYLDLQPFATVEKRLQSEDVRTFAREYAHWAFQRLSARVETAVTVAVYDIVRVQTYINSVDTSYRRTLTAFGGQFAGSIEYYDCAENPAYVLPGMNDGVYLYYRPARFGRTKNKREHSGWECSRYLQ
ncbi:MAG: hypothetical protein IH600_08050 [Bacteroidetes bacterium]|nr:hypothetical protein [Bacteroidota bacterium]